MAILGSENMHINIEKFVEDNTTIFTIYDIKQGGITVSLNNKEIHMLVKNINLVKSNNVSRMLMGTENNITIIVENSYDDITFYFYSSMGSKSDRLYYVYYFDRNSELINEIINKLTN